MGCSLIALTLFGRELGDGLLTQMFAQPVKRQRLFRDKAIVAALGLSLLAITFLAEAISSTRVPETPRPLMLVWTIALTVPLFAFGVGTCLTLWTRQPVAAFWLLVFTGGLIRVTTSLLADWASMDSANWLSARSPLPAASGRDASFSATRTRHLRRHHSRCPSGSHPD